VGSFDMPDFGWCGFDSKKPRLTVAGEAGSKVVAQPGIEPGTQGFSVLCSTN
jgi:hypothetical protein